MIERIYTLSYYHHQIGSVNYYPLFRVRSWNDGRRCMSLYILMVSLIGISYRWIALYLKYFRFIRCLSRTPTLTKHFRHSSHYKVTQGVIDGICSHARGRCVMYSHGGTWRWYHMRTLSASCVEITSVRWNSLRWSHYSCWRHQMETFSTLLTLCAGNSPITGEFPSQRPVTRSFDVFLWSAPEQTVK